LKASVIPSITTDVSAHGPSVSLSVRHSRAVHPAKAMGQSEMPFGRNTVVVPSNIVLDRGPGHPTGGGKLGGRNPQFAAMPPIAKFFWPPLLLLNINKFDEVAATIAVEQKRVG